VDHDANQESCEVVGNDEEVDEEVETGYGDMEGKFFGVWNSDDDDEGKKRDFLLKNVGWICLGAFLGVLWV
jgi:hypothetical protein